MCKFYGYTRVSTRTQSEKGYGLDAQQQAIEKYTAEHGVKLEKIFTDAGISGAAADNATDEEAISKRTGLIELLSTLEAGDKIIVLNTSRLWRSKATSFLIPREIMNRKADVVSIEQPNYSLYNESPDDYLRNALMEILDTYDKLNVCLKLARGRTVKAKTGAKPAGICPYGYQYAPDKKSVIINPEEAQHVKFMFREGQKGRTLGQIADALNAQGVTTRRGGIWQRGSIQAILKNKFYTGVLTHAGQEIAGTHEPLISKIQYGKVQSQLKQRHR